MSTSPSAARWRALAMLSAIFGAGVSVYLLVEYTTGQAGVCLTGSGCDEVRASDFAYPFGMPMPLFGVAFYVVAAWVAHRTLHGAPILGIGMQPALVLLAVGGVVASAALTAIEAFVIEAFCTWCLASAGASLVLLIAAVGLWLSPPENEPAGHSSRVRQQRARARDAERQALNRVATWGSAATTVLVGALLLTGAVSAGPGPEETGDELAPADSPRLGSGAVTVVEWADFQCPACSVVGPMLQDLAENDEMTLVFRHFPLESIHANANSSSRAAEAAERQGAFYAMAELLYARQSQWSNLGAAAADEYFAGLAAELGLDVERWRADYTSPEVRNAVAADASAARDLNLSGTPTIYIGGQLYEGERSPQAIRAALAAAAARQDGGGGTGG